MHAVRNADARTFAPSRLATERGPCLRSVLSPRPSAYTSGQLTVPQDHPYFPGGDPRTMSKPPDHEGSQAPQQPVREVSFAFSASIEAVPLARAELFKTLCDWGLEQFADDLLLCLSEAVTNALFYVGPGSTVTVHVTATDHTVHIEVDDDGDAEPKLRTPVTANGESTPNLAAVPAGGYGLMLIQALSDNWGVRHLAVGKAVWFERHASWAAAK